MIPYLYTRCLISLYTIHIYAQVKLTMIFFAIRHVIDYGPNTLLRSLLPDVLYGSVDDNYTYIPPAKSIGEEEAKTEARNMMIKFAQHKRENKLENEAKLSGNLEGNEGENKGKLSSTTTTSSEESEVSVGELVGAYPAPFNE